MHLETLYYYYQTTGVEGGLFSINFTFLPFDADAVKDPAQMKLVARENYERLLNTLDEMLLQSPHFDCKREPVFMDSPGKSSGGYCYKGKISGKKLSLKIDPPVEASVGFELSKGYGGEINIDASFQLTHAGNIKALQTMLALPDISIGDDAQQQIDSLNNLIQTTDDTDSKILHLLEPARTNSDNH